MTVDQKAIFLHIQCLNKRLKQTVKFLLNYFFTYIFWSHFEIMLNVARSKKVKIISTLIKIYIWGSNHTLKSADIYLRNCDYDFRLLCALLPFSQNSFQILFFV